MSDVLESRGVTKTFGDFTAIDDVSLSFDAGRIHAIVGQNGAGKTTFSRLICGLYEPTSGSIAVDGVPLRAGSIRSTRAQGVDMVHQNFSLPPGFTVMEAMQLFDTGGRFLTSRRRMLARWGEALERRGSSIDPRKRIRDLSVEARQSLEIIRALEGDPRVLILDEPTAVLAPSEVDELFAQLRQLRDRGLTILIILHKLNEVFAVADTISVLREGRVALATAPVGEVDRATVTEHIIGPASDADAGASSTGASDAAHTELGAGETLQAVDLGVAALQLIGLSTEASQADRALEEIDITVAPGEIYGIAGVEGNGQETLFDTISGVQRVRSGRLLLGGADLTRASVLERRRRGMRAIPSDRNAQGISLTTSIWQNIALSDQLIRRRHWLRPAELRRTAAAKLASWKVRYRTVEQQPQELSGGNVQRVILARELGRGARLVLAANPTRGLDLAATEFVRTSLRSLAEEGVAVVLVSADLDEVRELSDRVGVLRGGRLVGEFPAQTSAHDIGLAMVGGQE